MGELVDVTASSLAIVEKKPQRPGGCVGIFFQLFDWNRRFAKKKLFSKKLLPPGRLKHAAKKFRGDETKLRLIADENSGGFPNSKKNNVDLDRRQDTRTPSLVARLMGLESMPTLQREKSKKVRISSYGSDKADKFVDNIQENLKEDELDVEKGGGKNELRPQKLQKTSCSEKHQQVARFGTEILPFTNALTKSRKNQYPKLPVPPAVKSPRNFSRRNASKLIGAATRILEPGLQTSRSKYAITYSNTSCNPPMEEMTQNLGYSTKVIPELKPSCRNCGNCFDESNQKRRFEKNLPVFVPLPSRFTGIPYQESEKMKMGHSTYYGEFEEEFQINNTRHFSEHMPQHFSGKRNKPQKDLPMSSLRSNRKSQNSNHMSRSTEMMPPRSKFNALPNETNFGSFSRSVNGRTRPQVSSPKMDNCKFQREKGVNNRQNELVRKRRPTSNVSRQSENSIDDKQIYGSMNGMPAGQVDNNVVSFTFNSRAKPKSEVSAVEKGSVQIGSSSYSGKPKFDPLCGDDLGLLLKQKLRELNSQGDDIGGNAPKKTTAMILHELIAALTSESPFQLNNSQGENVSDSRQLSSPTSFINSKANETTVKHVDQPLECDRLSPGSVLEAYFSNNDSFHSSSLDDNSETLDSATSITTMSNKDIIAALLDNVSETLCAINLNLKGIKFDHAKEMLVNSELMFQNAAHSDSVDQRGFSVNNFFLDEITTLATILWMNFGSSIGMEDRKEMNQLKRFAFDSTIEYLEMMFERLYKSGSAVSTKLPQQMSTNMLMFDIVREVRKWEQFSQLFHDELIEVEMSLSLGEWTRFEPDMFDTSMEISDNVMEFVLDEILMDLCSC